MTAAQIFTDNDIVVRVPPWLDLLSLLKCRQLNKQWFQICSDSLLNTWTKFEEYSKLYLTKHGMMDETIQRMYDSYWNELKRCHLYISNTAHTQEEKPFLLNKILKRYIDVMKKIIQASKTEKVVNHVIDALVVEYNTFVSVIYPNDISYSYKPSNLYPLLLKMVPIGTFDQLIYPCKVVKDSLAYYKSNDDKGSPYRRIRVEHSDYEWFRKSVAELYIHLVEKEAMRIVLTHPTVAKYNNVRYNAAGNSDKNLLLLDWDQTLYNDKTPRDGLHEFLKSACKHFCVWIETGGYDRKEYISKLNEIDGINICGVIYQNKEKWRLNKWILQNQWFGVNSKFENFLLIDDLWQQNRSKHKFINTIIVPRMAIDNSDKSRVDYNKLDINKLIEFLDFDKNVLSKLMQWLEEWNQYTNIKKHGSTTKFIQENGLPTLKFTLYDDDRWFFDQLLDYVAIMTDPNYKYKHLKQEK